MQKPEARWIQDGTTQLGANQDRQGAGGATACAGARCLEEASDRNEGAGSCSTQGFGVCDAKQLWGCLRPTAGEGVEAQLEAMWIAAQASLLTASLLPQSCVGDGEFSSGPGSSWRSPRLNFAECLRKTNRQVEAVPVAEGFWMREEERKVMYRCGYCGQLVGCSEQGEIGMYSLKIFRMHEKECVMNASLVFSKG